MEDYDAIPSKDSDLLDWRIFAVAAFGEEAPMVKYLDDLCVQFTAQYIPEMLPGQFLDHLLRKNQADVDNRHHWDNCAKWAEEH